MKNKNNEIKQCEMCSSEMIQEFIKEVKKNDAQPCLYGCACGKNHIFYNDDKKKESYVVSVIKTKSHGVKYG